MPPGIGEQLGRTLRLCVIALGCAVLANCSAAEKFARTDKTQRIAEDAEIAKGGGHYKLGKPYSINGRTYTPTEEPIVLIDYPPRLPWRNSPHIVFVYASRQR